jgi:hypothetical protein
MIKTPDLPLVPSIGKTSHRKPIHYRKERCIAGSNGAPLDFGAQRACQNMHMTAFVQALVHIVWLCFG